MPLLLVMMTYTQPVFPPLDIALTDIHSLDTYHDLNHNLYLPNPNPNLNLWAGNDNSRCGDPLTGSWIPMWLCFHSLLRAVSVNSVYVSLSLSLSLEPKTMASTSVIRHRPSTNRTAGSLSLTLTLNRSACLGEPIYAYFPTETQTTNKLLNNFQEMKLKKVSFQNDLI